MAHSNTTANYGLPKWVAGNHPEFIADLNPAMETIDITMKQIEIESETSSTSAQSALGIAQSASDVANEAQTAVILLDSRMDTAESGLSNLQTRMLNAEDEIEALAVGSGVVLWTNANPLIAFNPQTIVLSESLAEFETYEILYASGITATTSVFNTGKIPKDRRTTLSLAIGDIQHRAMSAIGSNTMQFGDGNVVTVTTGVSTVYNTVMIPLKVIGYK